MLKNQLGHRLSIVLEPFVLFLSSGKMGPILHMFVYSSSSSVSCLGLLMGFVIQPPGRTDIEDDLRRKTKQEVRNNLQNNQTITEVNIAHSYECLAWSIVFF